MKYSFLLLFIFFIVGCQNESSQKEEALDKTPKVEDHTHHDHNHNHNHAEKIKPLPQNISGLQGKWQAKNEMSKILEVKNNQWIEYEADELKSNRTFSLNEQCTNGKYNVGGTKKDHFINFEEGACLFIVRLSPIELTLGDMGTSQSISYQKITE